MKTYLEYLYKLQRNFSPTLHIKIIIAALRFLKCRFLIFVLYISRLFKERQTKLRKCLYFTVHVCRLEVKVMNAVTSACVFHIFSFIVIIFRQILLWIFSNDRKKNDIEVFFETTFVINCIFYLVSFIIFFIVTKNING